MKTALFVCLALFAGVFLLAWVRAARNTHTALPSPSVYLWGALINFLDTLGIGSFATMSAYFKLTGLVKDEQMPGTLNVSATIPGILEAFIYVAIVDVDITTLIVMITASVLGAWVGARYVSRWPRRRIQLGMGLALTASAMFGLATQLHWLPAGGDQLGLAGAKLLLAFLANGLLGALMTLGIGFFAPCMMVIYLLGMSPKAAFPIMMGSVAFLGPIGSLPFLKRGHYDFKASLGMTLGGIPGVLIAAYVVRSLPLYPLRWLMVVVMLYTAAMMLRSAFTGRTAASPRPTSKTATTRLDAAN